MIRPCFATPEMDTSFCTLPDRLRARAARTPNGIAYLHQTSVGEWQSATWNDVVRKVEALAASLVRLGLRSGDRVAIMLPTSPEWEYCQFAAMAAGGIVIGIDAHDAPQNLLHILRLTSPKVLIAASGERLKHLTEIWEAPDIAILASAESIPASAHKLAEQLSDRGEVTAEFAPSPDQIATIIFTSGSTGEPKGIAYSHKQIGDACDEILDRFPSIRDDARLVCWLPLSNLFQRMINYCAIVCGARTFFVEKPESIVRMLPQIQPTFFIGVPRFFEKLHAGIVSEIGKQPGLARCLVRSAWQVGIRNAAATRAGTNSGLIWRMLRPLAETILRRVRSVMGSNLEFMVSGSAPLPAWLMERFHGLGWLVLEAYGISENVVPVALNTPDRYRFGSVGLPLPCNELRIADDNELLVRGPGVCTRYYGEGAGQPLVSGDGFLHTGDYASIDADGYVWLAGRKSEVFKTSTGRRIAPTPIESALKQISYVEHAVIVGRDRPYPVAILALNPEHPVAENLGSAPATADIVSDVAAACADLPDYQRPGAVIVTTSPFSVAGGELTANLKIRRMPIEERFRVQIGEAYSYALPRHDKAALSSPPLIIAP